MKYDYIIIGAGLAGSILYDFLKQDATVLVLDNEKGVYGSRVAAGIYNPVTGRRMVKSWMIDTLAPFAKDFYKRKEQELEAIFLQTVDIKRLFHNEGQRNEWLKKVDFYGIEEIVVGAIEPDLNDPKVHVDHGGVKTTASWRLDTDSFLDTMQEQMREDDALTKASIQYHEISLHTNEVRVGEYRTKRLIFCEGWKMTYNPWFTHLCIVPNKGEVLTISAPELDQRDLLQKGMFVLPIGDGHYKVGATYNKEQVDYEPTAIAKNWLLERLDRLIKVPYNVIEHKAGVRPTSKDRRPLLGQHPEYRQLFVFNGFGSKGVSQIPWCAQQMINHLSKGEKLHPEVDIQRFL